ncbi:HAD family hydrolase [Nonomuraea sp. NBC_01738]|uniref:HAD family hydrolase n=1 Tax=Nonomuraea sp. NBC_01738 TaxID=2976003 RepID=UPI002E0F691E|nr:HAD family hydrolase [Nonomuraea sp. NBC_01738]
MIRAILFDLDGTLMDHRAAADAAITAWVAGRSPGHPRLAEAPALWLELEERHLASWHRGEASWQEQRRRRIRALCDDLDLDVPGDLDAAFASYGERYREGWVPYPDAPAITELAGDYRLGVLTNGGNDFQRAKMRAIGLAGLGPVLSGDVLGGQFKPAPGCYLNAAAELGLEPGEILLVGDDLTNDVTAPAATGMRSIWLDRLGAEPVPEGFPRITTLTALPQYLSGHSDLG